MIDLTFAAKLVLGHRPSGGPYTVVIHEDARHLTHREYRVGVEVLVEGERAFFDRVHPAEWKETITRAATEGGW